MKAVKRMILRDTNVQVKQKVVKPIKTNVIQKMKLKLAFVNIYIYIIFFIKKETL